jgi:hypothetical protein
VTEASRNVKENPTLRRSRGCVLSSTWRFDDQSRQPASTATLHSHESSRGGRARRDRSRDRRAAADHKVDYRFRCSDNIVGYAIVSVDEIASFDPEGIVQDPMTFQGLNSESYSCEGVLPSHGEVCNGKAGQGHVVTSSIDTDPLPCSSTSNFYLTVADAKGAPAGVFTLGRPRGCPRAVRARRQSHKAVRRSRR